MTISNAFRELAGGGLEDFAPKPRSEPPAPTVATPRPAPAAAPQPAAPPPTARQLESLAAAEGFAVDNFPVTRKALRSGRVASREKAQPMTLRLRVADWNRFSAFCERNGYTVADGFGRLADFADTQ